MNPKNLLKKLTILTVISLFHIVASVLLYQIRHGISAVLVGTALINSWLLLKYFAYTIQHILAHRLAKHHNINHRFVINIILGIVLNALMIYTLFVMIIAHALVIIEQL